MCDPGRQADYLYNISYIEPLHFHALSGDMANASNSWILVDCEYTGILLGDTTCFKIYLVDKQMKTFTTVIVFTLTMDRPLQKLHSTGGVVMATSTPIAALHVTDDKRGVTSSERASYYVAVGLTFPYEWSKFEPVILGALNPVVSPWEAQIISTGEEFTMAGTSGFYRGAPNLQASFNTYIWNLASDPIEFASDAWGWIRCFLGLGIASNIILNMLVALMVMVHMWQQNRTVWIPDIYTSVQSRAALRGFLLLLDSIWNNWFYPYQYAVQQVENRSVMEGTTFMDAIPRADGLMICLGITYGISRLLGVRVRLFVIVLIYFVSFYYRIDIVNCCGILSKSTSHMAMDLYMANIIPGNGGMDLWAYREDNSINVSLIVN
ncbi:hypothetical protein AeMF1_002621 [Aphanomyces euteiches]|nr:hypothetical protein AeMF1_002621 [Aphanomyces euteiches]